MEDEPALLLSYSTWRAEAARISGVALNIARDDRLDALLSVVAPPADGATSTPATSAPAPSTSFFSQFFSGTAADAAMSSAAPWCVSLAELLALAELPASHVTQTSSSSAAPPSDSSASAAHRHFVQVIAAVASSGGGNALPGHGGHAFVSSSHAALPMSLSHSSSPAAAAPSMLFDDDRDDEGDGDFDRMFARLKQQAAERGSKTPRRRSSGAAPTPARTPPQHTAAAAAATGVSSGTPVGLHAARMALDAVDALLLGVRVQNQQSTAPSGRITEAQTLLLRATVCREAQLYSERVQSAVSRLLERHFGAHTAGDEEGVRRPSTTRAEARTKSRDTVALNQQQQQQQSVWAACVQATTSEQLHTRLKEELACAMSGKSLAPFPAQHTGNKSFNRRSSGSPPAAGSRSANASLAMSVAAAGAVPTSANSSTSSLRGATNASPTSASSTSFYQASHMSPNAANASFAPSASPAASATATLRGGPQLSPVLSTELVVLVQQWWQLVATQQRAMRSAEVHDYVTAGHIFLAAAAERAQLGGGSVKVEQVANAGSGSASRHGAPIATVHTPSADLASHGVTHVLRACGLLLKDPFLPQEIAYPASLLSEVAEVAEDAEVGADVVLPSLLATPHAPRVWMLLTQTAAFLERHHLQLPWDTVASTCPSPPRSSFAQPAVAFAPPVAHAAASTSTIQMLWEVSAAVLLLQPAEALHTLQAALALTEPLSTAGSSSQRAKATAHVHTSLHALFCADTPEATVTRSTTAASTRRPQPGLMVQPGTLPLCLLSLRRASAAAVRARHYAEALRNAEVALYFMQAESEATASKAKRAAAAVGEASPQVVDYSKVAYWPAASREGDSSATRTCTRTAACTSALTWMESRVRLHLMRVLLLLLTVPLTAGDAAASMFRQGELVKPQAWTSTAGSVAPTTTTASRHDSNNDDAAGAVPDLSPTSSLATSPVKESGEAAEGAKPSTAAENVAAVLRLSLEALRTMAAQLRVVEEEDGMVGELGGGASAEVQAQRVAAASALSANTSSTCPFMPREAYRLSTVLKASSVADAATTAVATEKDGAAAAAGEAAPSPGVRARPTCSLTSSARYQLLKAKHQAHLQPLCEELRVRDAVVDGTGGAGNSEVEAREANGTNSDVDEDDANGIVSFPHASAAMEEVHLLVQELLLIVCLLTMPLRAASTCTITPDTALPLGRGGGGGSEGGERGYDKESAQARRALNGMDVQLERCLRRLGARDRVLFKLLRRLQVELLFPAVCGPPI